MKKIIGKYVLIEQTSIRKESSLILGVGRKVSDKDLYTYDFKVLMLGSECPKGEGEVQVGDSPVFSMNVTFQGAKIVSEEKNDKGLVTKNVTHTIVYYDDIIAVE